MSQRITRLEYCQYLLSSQTNYTLTNFAEHVAGLNHHMVNRYLSTEKLTGRMVWEQIKEHIVKTEEGFIVFDDTVIDKRYSRDIETTRWQYSGNAHKVIRGIGLVTCIYVNPGTGQFWLIDYRIFDPANDGKSKMDHVLDMLKNIVNHKDLPFSTVLMDSWYANKKIMLYIHRMDKKFYCPVKKNRLAYVGEPDTKYKAVSELTWSDIEIKQGKNIQLRFMPGEMPLKLFQISISTNRTDYVLTNDTTQSCANDTQQVCAIRWYIEQFHRELKQLTGVEKCQCRKQRIQRNHIACSIMVWGRLKYIANKTFQTVYQIKQGLLKDYLIQQLKSPSIAF